jgi:hypothetical protein
MHANRMKLGNSSTAPKLGRRCSARRTQLSFALLLVTGLFAVIATLAGCGGSSYTSSASTSVTQPTLPSPSSLPSSCVSATTASSYMCNIAVTNGKAPFTWSVSGLPKGLSFSISLDTTTLTISGTPQAQVVGAPSRAVVHSAIAPAATTTTTVSVTVTVTDANGTSATLPFTITITSTIPALSISTNSLPAGTAGASYSATISATGGVTPYTWNISGLPSGLTSASGSTSATISGITDQVGTFTVSVTVTDSESPAATASATLTLTVSQAATLMVSTTTLPNGNVGVAYSQSLTATGGVTPETWSLIGALPAGLSLSSAGVISGTPTASGTASFSVRVTDSESPAQSPTQTLTITINAASGGLSITTTSPLTGASLNTAYSTSVTATGGTSPYNWSADPSSLPPGLSLSTSGTPSATLSGTPIATGTYQFTVTVRDSASSPATAFATFLLTVTGSSTLNCPATVNLTLCGMYLFGLRGFDGGGGPITFGGNFVADNSGNIVSGTIKQNDGTTGFTTITITGGAYKMDTSGDGRGVVSLIGSDASFARFRFVLESAANGPFDGIEEFDGSGVLASGVLGGPVTPPIPQLPANAVLPLALEGVNGAGQRSAFLGNLVIGATGCDGSSGSLKSLTGEPVITNTAGTVNTSLTITGSCTPADPNTGLGTAQITISGGSPFTNATLHFAYFVIGTAGVSPLGATLLETDAIAANQPVLSGLASSVQPPAGGFNATSLGCPCLFVGQGTTNGTVFSGGDIASIVRILTTPGTGANGELSGTLDRNAAGTITLAGTWPYTSYAIDPNGVGTITGTNSPAVHFIASGSAKNGFTMQTLDESTSVQVGSFRLQNSVSIESPGLPYVVGRDLGVLGVTRSTTHVVGVVIPSGTTSGTISGALDVISSAGPVVGTAATGTYAAIDSTGRGTGTMNLTAGSSSVAVVIYARRHSQFVVLDVQSSDPYLIGARNQ